MTDTRCTHAPPRFCAQCGRPLDLAEECAEARNEIFALQRRLREEREERSRLDHYKGHDDVSPFEVERVVKGYDGQRARGTIGERRDVRERIARALLMRMRADEAARTRLALEEER